VTFAVLNLCSKSSQKTESDRSNGISRKPTSSLFSMINGETFATSSGSNYRPSATLNQRAVGSTPTRPTKFLNDFHIFLLSYVNLVPTHGVWTSLTS
jgi:hypothetical protein